MENSLSALSNSEDFRSALVVRPAGGDPPERPNPMLEHSKAQLYWQLDWPIRPTRLWLQLCHPRIHRPREGKAKIPQHACFESLPLHSEPPCCSVGALCGSFEAVYSNPQTTLASHRARSQPKL